MLYLGTDCNLVPHPTPPAPLLGHGWRQSHGLLGFCRSVSLAAVGPPVLRRTSAPWLRTHRHMALLQFCVTIVLAVWCNTFFVTQIWDRICRLLCTFNYPYTELQINTCSVQYIRALLDKGVILFQLYQTKWKIESISQYLWSYLKTRSISF